MDNTNMAKQLADFLDATQTRKMVSRCQPNDTRTCYLLEAVQLILTYGKGDTNIDTLLNSIPAEASLFTLLDVALQRWLTFVALERPDLQPSETKKKIN